MAAASGDDREVEWSFKSCKQLAKIRYYQKNYSETLRYIALLIGMLPELNGNYAEDSINKLLLRYMNCSDRGFVSEMYDIIVNKLQDSVVSGISGHRLWLRININRFDNLLEANGLESARCLLDSITDQLARVSELTRNSFALDVLAAEIEYSMHVGCDIAQLTLFYRRSILATSAITHPRVMGVIRECGATVHFHRGQYEKARLEFYESFKNYDEAGSSSKKKILKYLGLCSLLTDSEVNPFESQETQSYSQLPEYSNLILLIAAYENRDLDEFYNVLHDMKNTNDSLLQDRLFQVAEKQVLQNLKIKVLMNYLKASKAITFDYLKRRLGIEDDDSLENLLLGMANSGLTSEVSINYIDRIVEVGVIKLDAIIPICADSTYVWDSFLTLYRLGYKSFLEPVAAQTSQMDIDSEFAPDHFGATSAESSKTFLIPHVYARLLCESPQVKDKGSVEEWCSYMKAAIPSQKSWKADQKEWLLTKEENVRASTRGNDDESHGSTQEGILGSSINYSGDHVSTEEPVKLSKIDALINLTHSIACNYRNVL